MITYFVEIISHSQSSLCTQNQPFASLIFRFAYRLFPDCGCKGSVFLETSKTFGHFFSNYFSTNLLIRSLSAQRVSYFFHPSFALLRASTSGISFSGSQQKGSLSVSRRQEAGEFRLKNPPASTYRPFHAIRSR